MKFKLVQYTSTRLSDVEEGRRIDKKNYLKKAMFKIIDLPNSHLNNRFHEVALFRSNNLNTFKISTHRQTRSRIGVEQVLTR